MPHLKLHLDRTVDHLRRYQHIMSVLAKYGLDEVGDAVKRKPFFRRRPSPVRDDPHSRPRRVRLALEEMGPTFIKLGQLLSTRPDLVGPLYVEEFERLQDHVAPERLDAIRAELAAQLGAEVEKRFRRFEPRPIAAGSIAQVHAAETLEGDRVAVKVRRPGIVEAIQTECEILEGLAELLKATLSDEEPVDPVRIVREFTEAVQREVRLDNERRNIELFRTHFADDPAVRIVQVYPDYCADGVLTMEFLDGVKPTGPEAVRQAGLDGPEIASRLADFILKQVFELGFFHTDPHPGNLFILPGNVLAPIDFGQVACLSGQDRLLLGELILTIVEQDAARLVEAFGESGLLDEQTDLPRLKRDVEEVLSVYRSLPLKDIPFAEMMKRIFHLVRRHRVRLPAEFTLMAKSLMIVESLATGLDADFRLIGHIQPYARRLAAARLDPRELLRQGRRALREAGDLALKLPGNLTAVMEKIKRGQFQMHVQHEHLESLVKTMGRSSNRLSFALIIAGLLVGSSLLIPQEGLLLELVRFQTVGVLGYLTAAALGLWLLVSIIRGRHV